MNPIHEDLKFFNKDLMKYCVDPSDSKYLKKIENDQINQVLPFLVRLWKKNQDSYVGIKYTKFKQDVFRKINKCNKTNNICFYLDVEFSKIYDDIIRTLSLRKKTQKITTYSFFEYETSSLAEKLIMTSNILLNGTIKNEDNCKYCSIDFSLFDSSTYYDDLSDLICIIHAELGEVISLSAIIFTLLHTKSASKYILKLLANSVDSIFQIIDLIIDGCNCNIIDYQRHICLISISESCWFNLPSYIVSECLRKHTLPSVIINLSIKENLLNVLLSIFQFETERNWFIQFLRSPNKSQIEKQCVENMREELIKISNESNYSEIDSILFKIYSAFRAFAGLKFNESELKALYNLVLKTKEISVAICFMLIYPFLYDRENFFERIVNWVTDNFQLAPQNLLLVAIFCSSNQTQLLNEFVSNQIGFKYIIKSTSFSSMTKLFHQVFQNDTILIQYTKQLPITFKLNTKTIASEDQNSLLGIYFLNQLIKNNTTLNKCQLNLNDWLFKQILECCAPIHPIIVTFINTYVNQIFNLSIQQKNRLTPLSKDSIFNFYKKYQNVNNEEFIVPKLLLLYYLLLFEEKKRETLISFKHGNKSFKLETNYISKYSNEIYDLISIKYLLTKAKDLEYFILYPSLLRITVNLFPYLCQVQHYLYDSQLSKLKNKNFNKFYGIINNLDDENNLPRNQYNKIKSYWFYGHSIHGSKLSLQFASKILNMEKLNLKDIYKDPLTLFRINKPYIFRCESFFEILLFITQESLIASKFELGNLIFDKEFLNINHNKEKNEMDNLFILNQDAAIIQILLDIYLLVKKSSNKLNSLETRSLICSYIHQMFINNASLAELLHNQGYPKSLIPVLVKGVPSMHICLDFLPKLLTQNDLKKQIFAISLIESLCKIYPIVRTYNVAKLAINIAHTLLQVLTIEERKKMCQQILNEIEELSKTLPLLTTDFVLLLATAFQTKAI